MCLWPPVLKPLAVGWAVVHYGSSGRVSNCKLNSKPPACGFNCGLADWQSKRSHWCCRQTDSCSFIRFPLLHSLFSPDALLFIMLHESSWKPASVSFIQWRKTWGKKRGKSAGVLLLSLVSWLHTLVFESVWSQCVSSCTVRVCVSVCLWVSSVRLCLCLISCIFCVSVKAIFILLVILLSW